MSFHINSPLPSSLQSECRKAARILNSFCDPAEELEGIIPPGILNEAKGLAIYSVLKGGFLFSARAGSGLVIARLSDGSWSAPSAIATGGVGVGGQIGAELTDFVMVLNTTAAVETFMHHGSITLGGNVSVAAGPLGRNAEASGTASINSVAAVYSYSKTRGLFAGISVEGSVILERSDANAKMYGRRVSTFELLNGTIPPPPQADPLYKALQARIYSRTSSTTRSTTHSNTSMDSSDIMHRAAVISGGYGGGYNQQPQTRPLQARALFKFAGEQAGDLAFEKGDIITIIKSSETQHDWWTGSIGTRIGIFPANFVQLL
ncbi:sh3 domain-containing protein [Lichtheimia corymbifera JMRC:FSU:9682]|uniref:Sh3 domain-containing protein n=1 Tax=Lichtheimia corymbifera JMRC:FSU:9682 TaxID=1263082 RepID=A0A068RIQ4_9FUNG|nr:sh3 domain-containing protein [Lichtheimia corymbifera JMRC:FSU:9682]